MLQVRVVVVLGEGDYTQTFEFDRDDITHLPSGWSGKRVRELLHEQANQIGRDVEAIWGKRPDSGS